MSCTMVLSFKTIPVSFSTDVIIENSEFLELSVWVTFYYPCSFLVFPVLLVSLPPVLPVPRAYPHDFECFSGLLTVI